MVLFTFAIGITDQCRGKKLSLMKSSQWQCYHKFQEIFKCVDFFFTLSLQQQMVRLICFLTFTSGLIVTLFKYRYI